MKLLAFAASNNKASINKQLVEYVATRLRNTLLPETTIDLIDLIDYELPLYRQDRESDSGIPEQAQDFFARIGSADAVIVSFAEHNGLYTAVY
ncbi:MAG: NAD(P)H-dependent oxidoreductase, partial [Planctomycetota bacterium]